MAPSSSTAGPISLHFQDVTRIAGEVIQGHVELNFQEVQTDHLESVYIKFKGVIFTEIMTSTGTSVVVEREKVPLFGMETPLWSTGTFPPPGTHTLTLPFQFTFPDSLPSSFHGVINSQSIKGSVRYTLEVVGRRDGLLRKARRIRRAIALLPSAAPEQLRVREVLLQGWGGAVQDFVAEEKLRQGLWGDYSHARIKLSLPQLDTFPVATTIPISFTVETDTKPISSSEAPVDKHGKSLFPALPASSADIKLGLELKMEVRCQKSHRKGRKEMDLAGSLGDPNAVKTVRHTFADPQWIPNGDSKTEGFWRRIVTFDCGLTLPHAPTTTLRTLYWKYQLLLKVPFPGVGNNLKLEVPIVLGPCSACPPPAVGAAGSSQATYADVLPAGPPPMMDLPPTYWTGEGENWDDDEKD